MSVTVNRTAQRFSSGAQAAPRMVLLHTTEGGGWPSYGGGSSAPHATIKPLPGKGIEVREHIPFGQFAKALQNRPGGVQTNTSGVLQFELMGTCDARSAGSMYYWPDADDKVLEALADYLGPIMSKYGIPARADVTFKSYNRGQVPSSYGLNNGVRMSFSKWNSYRGICGHQHAPENDHGDPGDFPISKLLAHLGGKSAPSQTGELSMSDVKKIMDKLDNLDEDVFKVAKDVKGVRTDVRNVFKQQVQTPKSVLDRYPWFNKSYSAGGLLGYMLILFGEAGNSQEAVKLLNEIDAKIMAEQQGEE